ncbi:MAG: hypothetical protein ACXABX_06175, partial [Candidatus Thorarchaeota archaeon]
RRLSDVLISMSEGSNAMGMREGAVELMISHMDHIRAVYGLLEEMTGIQLPEVEKWIESFIQ